MVNGHLDELRRVVIGDLGERGEYSESVGQ